jgi:hypothetical protein
MLSMMSCLVANIIGVDNFVYRDDQRLKDGELSWEPNGAHRTSYTSSLFIALVIAIY